MSPVVYDVMFVPPLATGTVLTAIVGLPETPSPFVTVIPVEAVIVRVVAVPEPVRTIIPVVDRSAIAFRSASYGWLTAMKSVPL